MVLSHPSATTTLIFNPYLPLVGRLLDVLLTYGPPETAIETCNRTLAQLAHCSAGAIPAALRRLEADGYIERVVTTHGSLITVAAQILERNPQLTIAEFETMCQIAQARRGVENGGIGLVFWCLLNNEPLYTPKELRSERRYSEHQRPNGPEPRAGGNNRRGWHCRPNQVLAA